MVSNTVQRPGEMDIVLDAFERVLERKHTEPSRVLVHGLVQPQVAEVVRRLLPQLVLLKRIKPWV
jgi:hypothetical protein